MILLLLLLFPFIAFADSGKATIVVDVSSGRILYENNIHTKRLIASITKVMTCMVVLENSNLEEEVEVGDEVLSMVGTNIYIKPGEKMTVKDLLYGMMLRSGNDAAMTLAVHTFGSEEEFVSRMNQKAEELGMKNTHFANPHGLDDETENYSTAYDMALLSRYAYQNLVYREIISTKKYLTKSNYKSYAWYNRMSLLGSYSSCIGGKNGYTPKAGKTLISLAKKGDLILTIVSLHDSDLYQNHKRLYQQYFKEYENYTIIDKKSFSIESSLVSNREFYLKESFLYPLKKEEISQISTMVQIYSNSNSKKAGEIQIFLKKEIIGEIPVYEKTKKVEKSKGILYKFFKLLIR